MAITVRIKPQSHNALKQIARITGESMQEALDRAIEERRRRVYLEGLKADYEALRADPKAAADFDRENELWDRSAHDGLEEA